MTAEKKKFFVTRPTLPSLEEYNKYLEEIWSSGVLTNRGPMVQDYEKKLATHLGVSQTIVTANATLALMAVMRSMGLSGEVITTPFTFAATASSIVWSGLTPVFVDTEPDGVNICPESVAAAITSKTCAILAVHCYGIPCNHDALKQISREHNLKLIYDACHAFGTEIEGESILELGDASVLSLHATKLVNSAEGGLIVSSDEQLINRIRLNINFGIANEREVPEIGINAKMSELHAALGLCNLELLPSIYSIRRKIDRDYRKFLHGLKDAEIISRPELSRDGFAYVPLILKNDAPYKIDEIKSTLESDGVFVRRYFYPLLTETDAFSRYSRSNVRSYSNAEELSSRTLCLPIYHGLTSEDVIHICERLARAIGEG